MSDRSLIIVFSALFIMSASFLFWQNARELDPNLGKSWWTLAFAHPETATDLAFTVENFSNNTRFQYEVVADKTPLVTESFELQRGEKISVTPHTPARKDVRISIVVTTGNEKKEIYRQ